MLSALAFPVKEDTLIESGTGTELGVRFEVSAALAMPCTVVAAGSATGAVARPEAGFEAGSAAGVAEVSAAFASPDGAAGGTGGGTATRDGIWLGAEGVSESEVEPGLSGPVSARSGSLVG